MYIFWMVAVGLVVGSGAGLLLHPQGFITSMVLGIVGSCAAALLGRSMGWVHGSLAAGGVVLSVCGAVLALALYGVAARRLAAGRR
jgi:uncharacterized membrane protein YeaQ/YmgE (transglycosylase-associated protein family)